MNFSESRAAEKKPSILIIDDAPAIRDILARVLARHGLVRCAASVEEGLEVFRRTTPGVVFTDYELPGLNGIEGIRRMKAACPEVRIIMLTGSATRELIEQARSEGARECLEKPFDLRQIMDLAGRYLAA